MRSKVFLMLSYTPYCTVNGVVEVQLHAFLTLALNGGKVSASYLARGPSAQFGQNAGCVLQVAWTLWIRQKSLDPAENEHDYRGGHKMPLAL
jgi:hypothetical protein